MIDLEKLKEAMDNLTPEEIEKYFPKDNTPKGWVSIEDSLPKMYADDIMQGYSFIKVKTKDGVEFNTAISDHNTWYYDAKEYGVTHWWND